MLHSGNDVMNKPKIVYIASPYTIGDVAINVRRQMETAHHILDMGHVPIAPLLSHFLHIHRPRDTEDWMRMDFALVEVSDVVLRLPGVSKGADQEEDFARSKGIPVVAGWEELEKFLFPKGEFV